jgi:hypothetical protein
MQAVAGLLDLNTQSGADGMQVEQSNPPTQQDVASRSSNALVVAAKSSLAMDIEAASSIVAASSSTAVAVTSSQSLVSSASVAPPIVALTPAQIREQKVFRAVQAVMESTHFISLETTPQVRYDHLEPWKPLHQQVLLRDVVNRQRGTVLFSLDCGPWSATNLAQASSNLLQACTIGKTIGLVSALHEAWTGAAYKQLVQFYTGPKHSFRSYLRTLGNGRVDPVTGLSAAITFTDEHFRKLRRAEYWWEALQLCPFAMFLVTHGATYTDVVSTIERPEGPAMLKAWFEEADRLKRQRLNQ